MEKEKAPLVMSSRTFEFTLTIVIPDEDHIQVSVSSPHRISKPKQVPSAPVKQHLPALVDEDSIVSDPHSAARSLYAEFNFTQTQPIQPFDRSSAERFDFSPNQPTFPSAYKDNLILSLQVNAAVGIPCSLYKRLKDFVANMTRVKGDISAENVVRLFEQYESWVSRLPERESRHLNRYQRMARFLNQ